MNIPIKGSMILKDQNRRKARLAILMRVSNMLREGKLLSLLRLSVIPWGMDFTVEKTQEGILLLHGV
jgi:hypothetical protein